MPLLSDETKQIAADLKSAIDAVKAAQENNVKRADFDKALDRLTAVQKQADAMDLKMTERHFVGSAEPSLIEELKSNEDVSRLLRDKRGTCVINLDGKVAAQILGTKTTLTETGQGFQTTGVMAIDRILGIVAEAREVLTVRDVLYSRPTSLSVVDFVKVTTPMSLASPVPEASTKPENQLAFTAHSEKVRTIATWLPASKQILDDMDELNGFISSSLGYYVNAAEELELLYGDGTGEHLNGLVPQASSFNTSYLSASQGYNKIDIIGRAIQQITTAKEVLPTFALVNPTDWWGMRLTKNTQGNYLLGDPASVVRPTLFGLTVVPTTSMSPGYFLVGSGDAAASEIRDRMSLQVEISTSHSDFFVKNLLAIRAEKRMCLVVKRAASYVTGTLITSPA